MTLLWLVTLLCPCRSATNLNVNKGSIDAIMCCHRTLITANLHGCDIKCIHVSFLNVLTLFWGNRWYQAPFNGCFGKAAIVISWCERMIHMSGCDLKFLLRYSRTDWHRKSAVAYLAAALHLGARKKRRCPFTCCWIAGLTPPPSGQVCHRRPHTSHHFSLPINQPELISISD